MRPTALHVCLTSSTWTALQAAQQPGQETRLGLHARIILLRAEGQSITAIAQAVHMSRVHIYKWLQRFQAEGVAGLQSRRRGRPRGSSKWR
jgi:transposase